MSQKPKKRNIVEGMNHMGGFLKAMPEIARLIEAEYHEEDLLKAYRDFMNVPEPGDDSAADEDNDGYGISWTNWKLKGRHLNFTICFEKDEMTYGWEIRCPDEETYYELKEAMSLLL
ncbi:MAG TPA: hypothetical protein VK484_14875 [Ferruginibacter sp.]|nr:hypothetical protein [Ferruginibacter sp.]